MKKLLANYHGFSLVELIVFIVVIGIVVAAILIPAAVSLQNSANIYPNTRALFMAQKEMELMYGSRRINGFNVPSTCNSGCTSSGYTVSTSILTPSGIPFDTASGYKILEVIVSGAGNAKLRMLISDY